MPKQFVPKAIPAAKRRRHEIGAKAIATWKEVVRASPGFADSGFRLAEAQTSAGDIDGAIATLDSYLRDVNPYDTQANVLLTSIGKRPPMENLQAVCRGLRSGAMSRWLVRAATHSLGTIESINQWPSRVEQARQDVAKPTESSWKDPLAPEVLRLEAVRLATLRKFANAAQVQRTAADAYRQLNTAHSPVARPAQAVADSWFLAAKFLFDSDATQFEAAYKMMIEAEGSVRLGVVGDIDDLGRKAELGDVVLASKTEDLCQLMRFSAKMRLMTQRDLRPVLLRIGWSIAGATHSQEELHAELGRIALELAQSFKDLPEAKRPAQLARIAEIVRRFVPREKEGPP